MCKDGGPLYAARNQAEADLADDLEVGALQRPPRLDRSIPCRRLKTDRVARPLLRQPAEIGVGTVTIVMNLKQRTVGFVVDGVTDVVGEITAAAAEQSQGIGEVNLAVTNLDQMTQQNAALVEESAAAAESLREQAQRLSEVVSRFRLDTQHSSAGHAVH